LNIPRYVDSSEKPESWDIYASMFGGIPDKEIADLAEYWDAFPNLKSEIFASINSGYWKLKATDVKSAVKNSADVLAFTKKYAAAFKGFDKYLNGELNGSTNISKEESVLSENIFGRLKNIPLVNAYEAYQILDNEWLKIAVDLEIIQTEGFAAVKQIDPNMVVKKKDNKEYEVQDGWVGHVLPFDLVQSKLLSAELASLKADEERLAEIVSGYEESLDLLPEDEKEKPFVNDDKDAFVWAEVKKAIKSGDLEPEILQILKKVQDDNGEEKKLKKQIKEKSEQLILATKKAIEELTDEQANKLLYEKWVVPLVNGVAKLPENVVDAFASKLEKLAEKYSTTFAEVEEQIVQTETELSSMLDELTGDKFDKKGIAEFKKLLEL
jgi:type I restriction enzyme M protein